jgi:hypothetical protein
MTKLNIDQIPDFNSMMETVDTIKKNALNREKKYIEIKSRVADIIKICKTDEHYFENGKPPAMGYVMETYAFTGFKSDEHPKGELIALREQLAEFDAELEHARLLNKVQHDIVEVFRTISANERLSVS